MTEILLRLRAVNAKKSIEYRHPDAIMRFCVVLQFKINSVIPPSSTRIRLKPASDGDPPLLIPRLSPDYSHTASVDPTRAMASLEKSEKPRSRPRHGRLAKLPAPMPPLAPAHEPAKKLCLHGVSACHEVVSRAVPLRKSRNPELPLIRSW